MAQQPGLSIFESIELINHWLDVSNKDIDSDIDDACRIMKVGEEFGEVVEAWIAYQGQNPRKYHPRMDADLERVFGELADVAIAALCAIQHSTKNKTETWGIFTARLEGVISRANVVHRA